MTLEIKSISDAADPSKERLVLRADGDLDVGQYAVFCCERRSATAVGSGNIPAAFWFEDKPVKKGDLVVLYTKKGSSSEKALESGSKTHFFYWGREGVLWTPNNRAVLVHTSPFKFSL